jgi:pimeloyl-ACP methyl ester carboxylesterase
MNITDETTDDGVTERSFTRDVDGETVPGVLWLPAGSHSARTFVLIGHGGLSHKRADYVLGLAHQLVRNRGYGVAALDAPGHGDRSPDAGAIEATRQALVNGTGRIDEDKTRRLFGRVGRHGGEWQAVMDDLQADGLAEGPFGYWGVSMGTLIGLPLTAAEPRIGAAVLGLAGLGERPGGQAFEAAARKLTVPVLFLFQWDDNLMGRESGLALFDAMGSKDKSMHINPGGHVEVPLHERAAAEAFYARCFASVPAPAG